ELRERALQAVVDAHHDARTLRTFLDDRIGDIPPCARRRQSVLPGAVDDAAPRGGVALHGSRAGEGGAHGTELDFDPPLEAVAALLADLRPGQARRDR